MGQHTEFRLAMVDSGGVYSGYVSTDGILHHSCLQRETTTAE
jgi:hypothetical protein